MKKLKTLLAASLLLGCSLANREGVDASCDELQRGAINACGDGIITTCEGGDVEYRVCSDPDACEADWQESGRYRCDNSEELPKADQGSSSGSGGDAGSGGGPGSGGEPGSGGSTNDGGNDCSSEECVLATVSGGIYDVVIDGSTAYLSGDGDVYSVPTAGGAATNLATVADSCPGTTQLAVGGGLVFVKCGDTVYRVPVAGGGAAEEVSGQSTIGRIAADSQRLFWGGSTTLNRQLHGGAHEAIVGTPWFALYLQVSDGFLYWYGISDIERVTVDGNTVQGFSVSSEPRDMVVVDSVAYLALASSIATIDLTSGTETLVASASSPRLVAANRTDVFWLDESGQAGIWIIPKSGGSPSRITEGTSYIRTLDADDSALYWADGSDLKKKVLQ